MMKQSKGFSLVELLVILVVMAILVALLLPFLGSIRASAEQTKCVSNLRNIAVAIRLYAQEHNNRLPELTWDRQYEQLELLGPYLQITSYDGSGNLQVHSDEVLHCPAATAENSGAHWPYFTLENDRGAFYTDYKLNDFSEFNDAGVQTGGISGWNVGLFEKPSLVVLAIDIDWSPSGRHNGKNNLVFLDGHIESLTIEQSKAADPAGNAPWYRWGM